MKKLFLLSMLLEATISTSAQFAGGSGTETDPYQITTAEQLQEVSNFASSCFIMTKDIDLTNVVWNPITTFTGTFDGNNKVVSNLNIESGNDGVGLFSRVNTPGILKNIILRNCYVIGGNWSGILCSTNGNWESKGGTFINCRIYDSEIDGNGNIGAFAGVAGGSFENCSAFNVKVEGSGNSIGGFSGDNENGGHYWNCTFYGEVTGSQNTGGICAFYNGTCSVDNCFENCVVYGNISSSTGTVGGILGTPNWNSENSHIINCAVFANCTGQCVGSLGGDALRGKVINCYATGNVKSTGTWKNGDYVDTWNGGICSVNFNGPIQDCYFSGAITSTSDEVKIAGICGRDWPGIVVKNCYYNSDGASLGMGDGDDPSKFDTKGMITEDMMNLSNFSFSDMTKWQIVEGETTPFFANQTAPLKINECTTTRISGTGETDLAYVYLLGSMSESINKEVKINNGTWTVELNTDDVIKDENITAIGFGKDKMPSMIVKAKVGIDTGIRSIDTTDNNAKVEAIYNEAGQRLNKIQQGKVNIIKYSNGRTVKTLK